MSAAVNVCLFVLALAKVAVLCGFAPALAFVCLARIRAVGVEQVPAEDPVSFGAARAPAPLGKMEARAS